MGQKVYNCLKYITERILSAIDNCVTLSAINSLFSSIICQNVLITSRQKAEGDGPSGPSPSSYARDLELFLSVLLA